MTTSNPQLVRSLIIYAAVLPLAIVLGYQMATPLAMRTLAMVGVILLVLFTPLILRWHHPLLILSWNMTAVAPLVPGRPQLWLVLSALSLLVSILQYTLTRRVKFLTAPSLLWPLVFITAVAFATAMLTGGIGLRSMGGETVGGRRYIFMFGALIGFIAITARRVPQERANLYVLLFLLGALTNGIGNLLPYVPPALYPLFSMFPVENQGIHQVLSQNSVVQQEYVTRFYGLSLAVMGLAYFMMARWSLTRLLDPRTVRFWVWVASVTFATIGGFRSAIVLLGLTVGMLFWLEGLHRTRKMPAVVIALVLAGVAVVAFAERLPLSMQRALTILPVKVDPRAELSARHSSEWRLEIWAELLPQVPENLFLGKGLAIRNEDLATAETLERQGRMDFADVVKMTGDYHNGPLSVIIPFGIWGMIGWIWFVWAGTRAVYLNYRNGDPALRVINRFFFAYFVVKMIFFHLVFGAFYAELMIFAGIVALSISLNGGIRVPAPKIAPAAEVHGPLSRPRLIPSFSGSLRR